MKNKTTSGLFRFATINHKSPVTGVNDTASAFVVQAKMETGDWKKVNFAIAGYFVERLSSLSGSDNNLHGDFFDAKKNSFTNLGEAYVNYHFNNGDFRFGRQVLENPFINTNEFRVIPNTFEASWLTYNVNDSSTIQLGKVKRWAGLDSGGSQDEFKEASNNGVAALGVNYKYNENVSLQAWQYNFDGKYNLTYFDTDLSVGDFNLSLQYSNHKEINSSAVDGRVHGITTGYRLGDISVEASVNRVENNGNKSIDLGLGGGNYYTSMDVMTISGITDAHANTIAINYDVSEKLSVGFVKGNFKNNLKTDIKEINFITNYSLYENTDIEYTYAVVDNADSTVDDETNSRHHFLRINYLF